VIEIGAALARNIPVVPVLVDGARMPKASELPDSLKPLARRQAIQVRHTNFRSDADALTKKMREALGDTKSRRDWWRLGRRDLLIAAVIVVVGALTWLGLNLLSRPDPSDIDITIANLSDTIRRDPKNADASFRRGVAHAKKGDFVRAITDYNEAIRLDPKKADAFFSRGVAYAEKGDLDRAITDYSEVIRLDPKNALAFANRGADYFKKGDLDRAVTDSSEAIRLAPERFAWTYCIRGTVKLKNNDSSGNADIAKARQLNPSSCR
jgi:tetratricopeptide (TPR) repeat protein